MNRTKGELLNLLGDVKAKIADKLGAVDFPMPQFILIGKQSVGKSRLIEAMAGETFNFVSGTLGSRRPTILEFRNIDSAHDTQWYTRNPQTMSWEKKDVPTLMKWVGEMHECLGADVTSDPIYVRIESAGCVDMQIVDLPGFRDFALDQSKQRLSEKIEALDRGFMAEVNNVILCVEQCGDASTMASLQKAREYDKDFKRTILIRTKLDKYYKDLTPDNASAWVDGHGDLPPGLKRFAMTLPFWKEGERPPKPFPEITEEKNSRDMDELNGKGLAGAQMATIGFRNFAAFMEAKIEEMFGAAVGPLLENLRGQQTKLKQKVKDLEDEREDTDPRQILNTTRDVGMSFSQALGFVMDGSLETTTLWTLEEELHDFHQHYQHEEFLKLPSTDFIGLPDYLDYLENEADLPTFGYKLNGGAQFRRMMAEVEIFLRFSEVGANIRKKDVIQALGISMTSVTWRDVVVKLLDFEGHAPFKSRLQYVGERIRYFFQTQKKVVIEFMVGVEGAAGGQMHSSLMVRHGRMAEANQMMQQILFDSFDAACTRQLKFFIALFNDMLTATFSNPWVFMKGATIEGGGDEEMFQPRSLEDVKQMVPEEIEKRSGIDGILADWLNDIPTEAEAIDEAVERVQLLVLKTYSFIRAHISDQVELLTETFFKVPLLRRLTDDMKDMNLSQEDQDNYASRRSQLDEEIKMNKGILDEMTQCVTKIGEFKTAKDSASARQAATGGRR